MFKCEVTRHLNGIIKLIIVMEEDDTLIINMDKITSLCFHTKTIRGETEKTEYCLYISNDSDGFEKYHRFKNKENYLKAKNHIERELLK